MDNNQLVKEITKSMAIVLPDEISQDDLIIKLSSHINQLIQNNFQKLISLLYRIDVSEAKLKLLLQEHPEKEAGKIIATLIIERQLQKIKTRQQFGHKNDGCADEEKW